MWKILGLRAQLSFVAPGWWKPGTSSSEAGPCPGRPQLVDGHVMTAITEISKMIVALRFSILGMLGMGTSTATVAVRQSQCLASARRPARSSARRLSCSHFSQALNRAPTDGSEVRWGPGAAGALWLLVAWLEDVRFLEEKVGKKQGEGELEVATDGRFHEEKVRKVDLYRICNPKWGSSQAVWCNYPIL